MARTHRYELDMMQVRLDWMTERLEAQEKAFRALLGAASRRAGPPRAGPPRAGNWPAAAGRAEGRPGMTAVAVVMLAMAAGVWLKYATGAAGRYEVGKRVEAAAVGLVLAVLA